MGFLGYYRTYVQDFSRKVKPIYDLLHLNEDKKPKEGKKQLDSRTKIVWNDELQKIVEDIVDYLKSLQVMAYPDFSKPFNRFYNVANAVEGERVQHSHGWKMAPRLLCLGIHSKQVRMTCV